MSIAEQFVSSFKRAIAQEMRAMRERLGPFEVSVDRPVSTGGTGESTHRYRCRLAGRDDKLLPHSECTLRSDSGEWLVCVEEIDGSEVVLASSVPIVTAGRAWALVIYPWFLYERLQQALDATLTEESHDATRALRLFGRAEPVEAEDLDETPPPEGLNSAQYRAVRLCRSADPAFIWGPPGTGKTTTLAAVVGDQVSRGKRVLITSTTNAAVDQALDALWRNADLRTLFDEGAIVRMGQGRGDNHGTGVEQLAAAAVEEAADGLRAMDRRRGDLQRRAEACAGVLENWETNRDDQLNLFGNEAFVADRLDEVLPPGCAHRVRAMHPLQGKRLLTRVATKLGSRLEGVRRRRVDARAEAAGQARERVVREARVVVATLSGLTISSLLAGERYDVVIVEEAGMAVLPLLYYCAGLAGERVVLIGDPRQLPPIVQSASDYVRRAMGRSIYDVGPVAPETMVMLDTQYRMHRVIGDLVSDLFYDGLLEHAEICDTRDTIASREPFPGHALVVVDRSGSGECLIEEGGYSRYNPSSLAACVDLSLQAVRHGSVAVITPYAAQSRLLGAELRKDHRLRDVECSTVHRFQGHERDVVIFDSVDSGDARPGVLLSQAHLINVTVSRARGKLIVLADVQYLRSRASTTVFASLVEEAVTRGLLVGSIV